MNDTIESALTSEYYAQGYQDHFNKIDYDVSAESGCEKCSGEMRYIGLKKKMEDRMSYIAISHCDNCGNEYEF